MKCRDCDISMSDCVKCDLKINIPCGKEFNYDIPKKYIEVTRIDHVNCSWNECPTCGTSIGYHPKNIDFRCPKCNQKILWE